MQGTGSGWAGSAPLLTANEEALPPTHPGQAYPCPRPREAGDSTQTGALLCPREHATKVAGMEATYPSPTVREHLTWDPLTGRPHGDLDLEVRGPPWGIAKRRWTTEAKTRAAPSRPHSGEPKLSGEVLVQEDTSPGQTPRGTARPPACSRPPGLAGWQLR